MDGARLFKRFLIGCENQFMHRQIDCGAYRRISSTRFLHTDNDVEHSAHHLFVFVRRASIILFTHNGRAECLMCFGSEFGLDVRAENEFNFDSISAACLVLGQTIDGVSGDSQN